MRRAVALLTATALLPAAVAGAASRPDPARARLQGYFQMAGRVTSAYNVRGEHTGQKVIRIWRFLPRCRTGACSRILLIRRRARGTDWVILHRRRDGSYLGRGSFPAPLSCAGRIYPRGERVPFTITVTVTAAQLKNGVLVATRVTGTYLNTYRFNRTPCVAMLGRDAARYHGHAIPAPAADAAAAAGSGEPSARSPAGS